MEIESRNSWRLALGLHNQCEASNSTTEFKTILNMITVQCLLEKHHSLQLPMVRI